MSSRAGIGSFALDARAGEPVHPLSVAVSGFDTIAHAPPVAVPPIAEMSAGFDAIWQVDSNHLNGRLSRRVVSVVGNRMGIFQVQAADLPESVRIEIGRRLLATRTSTVTIGGSPDDSAWLDIPSYSVRVRVIGASLSFFRTPLRPPATDMPLIRFNLVIEMGVPDVQPGGLAVPGTGTGAVASGSGTTTPATGSPAAIPPDTSTGTVTGLRYVPVAGGRALMNGALDAVVNTAVARCHARLRFLDPAILLDGADVIFQAVKDLGLLPALADVLAPLGAEEVRLTPRFGAVGSVRLGEAIPGLETFRVQCVAGAANRPGLEVLSLCCNAGPMTEAGDPGLVRAFLGDRELARYVTERIVQAGMRTRWIRADTPKVMRGDFPLDLVDEDGNTVPVVARIEFAIVSLTHIVLGTGASSSQPDRIRLRGSFRIQLLQMVRDGKAYSGAELGELEKPATEPFEIHIDPFGPGTAGKGPGDLFMYDIAGRLLEPLYRPTPDPLTFTQMAGRTSAAAGGIMQRWSVA